MIYIAAHKKFNVPQLDNYAVLQVGAQGKENLGYLQDNTGDNISYKNPNFCELTGLYWIQRTCSLQKIFWEKQFKQQARRYIYISENASVT